MATLTPHPRLKNVENAANFMALVQDNFEVLAAETAKREGTYQNGSPTTVIGPPMVGSRVLDEFWRDGLGGEWQCTGAGTPGTWKQIQPAAVTTEPGDGSIPVGYLILNVTSGQTQRHEGGYVWTVVGGSGAPTHSDLTYAASVALDFAGDGYRTLALTGDVTFTSSNRAPARAVAIRIIGDTVERTLTLNEAWKWLGAVKPTVLGAGKVTVLSLTAFGVNEGDVLAAYVVEP